MDLVCKGFTSRASAYTSGELGDFSKERNYKSLIKNGYLDTFKGVPNPCKLCTRKFARSIDLQAHILNAHPVATAEPIAQTTE